MTLEWPTDPDIYADWDAEDDFLEALTERVVRQMLADQHSDAGGTDLLATAEKRSAMREIRQYVRRKALEAAAFQRSTVYGDLRLADEFVRLHRMNPETFDRLVGVRLFVGDLFLKTLHRNGL